MAFNALFDAARYAAMTYLVTDETRWGNLTPRLPQPFSKQFRDFISYLHVRFSYDGLYPKDTVDETYQTWRAQVSAFIEELAART